jgi:UDP-N-acetylmuramyl pentapeptide synthase
MPNNKSFFQTSLEKQLFTLSKKVLKKYKPKIIAVTGSVGKTSTRQAIFTVLNYKFECRQSEENYNNVSRDVFDLIKNDLKLSYSQNEINKEQD